MLDGWELEFARSQRHAVLGTIARDGMANLVPACYAVVEGAFLIAVDEKPKSGRKLARLRNIERDQRATLLMERYDEDWTQLAWVRAECTARILERGSEHPQALAALRERYEQYREMQLEGNALIVLAPVRIVSWRWDTTGR